MSSIKHSVTKDASATNQRPKQLLAYLLGTLAQFGFVTSNYFIKKAQKSISPFQVQYYLFLQIGLYTYSLANYSKIPLRYSKPKCNRLLILRALMGMFNTFVAFYSFSLLPLSEISTIAMISPVITAAISNLYFGEKFDRTMIINGVLGIMGVLLIAKPSFIFGTQGTALGIEAQQRTLGILLCLFTAFFGAFVAIVIKKCGTMTHPISMTSYFGIITALCTPVSLIIHGHKSLTRFDILNLFIAGVTGTAGQVANSTAFVYGEAGKISLLGYSQIIIAFAYEIIFDSRTPDDYSVLGAGCILMGFLVMIYKTMRKPREISVNNESFNPVENLKAK